MCVGDLEMNPDWRAIARCVACVIAWSIGMYICLQLHVAFIKWAVNQ